MTRCFGYIVRVNYQRDRKESTIQIQFSQQEALQGERMAVLKILNVGYISMCVSYMEKIFVFH